MNDTNSTRRRFLLASLIFSTAAITGTSWLRSAAAWAAASDDPALTQFGRLLFPIDSMSDSVYADVMGRVMTALATNPATEDALAAAEIALDKYSNGDWYGAGEAMQISAIKSIQTEAFFAAILDGVRGNFHYHPAVWAHINYPGSSKEHGGYLHRGFNDIDWLPENS